MVYCLLSIQKTDKRSANKDAGNANSSSVLLSTHSAALDIPEPVGKDRERVLDVVGP